MCDRNCGECCRGLLGIGLFACIALQFVQVLFEKWSVAIHCGFTPFGPAAVSVSTLSLLSLSLLSKFHFCF